MTTVSGMRVTKSMGALFSALVLVAISTAMLIALSVSTVCSQSPVPPNIDVGNRQTSNRPQLNRDSRELADEYAELLIGLRDVVANYGQYLRDFDDDIVLQYRPKLDKLNQELGTAPLAFDERQLAEQLRSHTDQLRKAEYHIRDSKTIYPMRLYRLMQGLRREMLSFDDLLQGDVLPRFEENAASRKAILAYVSDVLKKEQRTSAEKNAIRIDVLKETIAEAIDAAKAKADVKRLEMLQKKYQVQSKSLDQKVPEPEQPGDVYVTPIPPVPPVPSDSWSRQGRSAGTGLSREFGDTVSVTGDLSPVKIIGRYGRMEVVGWNDDVIAATWSIEVSGASRKSERAFIDSAALKIRKLSGGYVVAPVSAQPNERTAQYIQNDLVIYLPMSCPVTIENAFGEVEVSTLKKGLSASTSYSSMTLDDIKGDISAACSMGELAVSNCDGPMNFRNAYSPITVEDCSGTTEIENAYSQVSVTDCRGKLSIKNSGAVSIEDHSGNVSIENSYGEVEVAGLKGNLDVANQYQPIIVRDIDGDVKLEGAYSLLDISNVKGDAVAVNKYGTIKAEGLSGPLVMDNEGGSTIVSLDDLLKGTSRINGKLGSIVVAVSETANLLVSASSIGGSISTDLPMTVTNRVGKAEGVLKLGRLTKDSLFLKSDGGAIIINSNR